MIEPELPSDPNGHEVGLPHPLRGSTWYLPCKLVLDFTLALVLLTLALPVILLAMLLVKLTSRGPALYTQVRLGLRGQPYTIYKIRSMYDNCESLTGETWAVQDDPRITPVGRILRRFHLDELPQLWNVLRGEMSLVGPRPERPYFVSQFVKAIPYYQHRMLMRPGLTGLAQIQLPPDTDLASVRRKLVCDLYYVHRLSFWLDLQILIGTACYLLGIPFSVTRSLLRVPSVEDVENVYHQMVAAGPQVQPA